jgi:DNA-binding IclR family transcriptional regulator
MCSLGGWTGRAFGLCISTPLLTKDRMSRPDPAVKTGKRAPESTAKASNPEADDAKSGSRVTLVKPVVNALHILRYLTETGRSERAIDIARHLGINQSTCFNILRTLVSEDVAAFDPLSKTYTAGIGLAKLVGQFMTQGQRIEAAKPPMRELAARFGVTVTLWRPIGTDRIVLVSSEVSQTDMRIEMAEGQRLPYLMGASGRFFAGQLGLNEDELREAFEKIRWSVPLTFETYWREVEEAKRRGYAIDDGNFTRGIMSVAAPVHDSSGTIAFAISAVMFREQFDKAGVATLGKAVKELGVKVSRLLF